MEIQISLSTFLPRHPQSLHVASSSSSSSSWINVKGSRMITAKLPSSTSPSKHLPLLSTNKNRLSSVVNNVLNTLDGLICDFLDRTPHPDYDPVKNAISDNFEPVAEVPPTACPVVVGSLPPCLDGAYLRNGPNPQFIPKGPYHIIHGDGMLHMIRISGGRATFCSRYVRTHKYEMEREFGNPVVPNFSTCFNGPAASMARLVMIGARVLIARQFDLFGRGAGVASTSVALLAGGRRLFALYESDLPYEIKVTEDGDIDTLGRHHFQSVESSFRSMTAHPKVDRETGESFAFRYNLLCRPFLTFHRIDREGRKQKDVPIFSKRDCTIVHDLGLTDNYAVFPDIQLAINPMWIFARGRGSLVGVHHGKTPRLGIIPRYADDESGMQWVDAPGLNMLHCVNAWEEDGGDTIVMVATNILKPEHFIWDIGLSRTVLEMVTVDLKAKSVRRHRLSASGRVNEFGTINPAYANKKIRYVYGGVSESRTTIGVEKFDLSLMEEGVVGCTVGSRMHGQGCYGGESTFVAKEPNNPIADEDDGYLVTYVHDENTKESRFIVMDAKSPDLDIIATVKLPQRVPSGFHGLFLSATELSKLAK